jgi:hypothetical protein
MSIRHAAAVCALLTMSCQGSARQFSRLELIGEYQTANGAGLVLDQGGTFLLCWRTSRGMETEVGQWDMDSPTMVVLHHRDAPGERGDLPFPIKAGPWTEGLIVVDGRGRACLTNGDMPSFGKLDAGQRACP